MEKKTSRFIGTLIPKKDAEAHMARRAHAVKDSFKLDEADFKAAIKQIICSNVIYLIASFLFIGFGGFVMTGAGSQTFIGVIQAAVGTIYFVLAFIALIGAKFESDRILLTYYSLQVFVMFFTLGVAGFTLVLTDQAANIVEQNSLQTPLEGSELSDQLQAATTKALSLRVFLYLCGGIGMALVPLQAYTLSVASSIVTELRAITILMETLTLTMFPLGCIMIAGGIWMAQVFPTGATGVTALSLFGMGAIIVALSTMGYFGVAIHSRGLLLMFQWPVLILTAVLFISGLSAFATAEEVKQYLSFYWSDIRQFMPVTFQGRYDKNLFEDFIEANLNSIGFGAIYLSIVLFVGAWGAGNMRHHVKVENMRIKEAELKELKSMERMEFEAEAEEEMRNGLSKDLALQNMRVKLAHDEEWKKKHRKEFHRQWKQAWTKGSKKSRCIIRGVFATICVSLVIVISIGITLLVYISFCEGLSPQCEGKEFSLPAGTSFESTIILESKYGRGQIEVLAYNSSTTPSSAYGADKASKDTPVLVAEACALVADAKGGSWSMNSTAAELGILAVSAGPDLEQVSSFLGQDTSCPRTTATLFVPSKLSDIIIDAESKVVVAGEGLNARKIYAAGEALNFAASALDIDHRVTAAEASQYTVQSTAAVWTHTDAGELRISGNCNALFANTNLIHGAKADAQCSNNIRCRGSAPVYPKPSAHFGSSLGFIDLAGLSTDSCDVAVESSDSAPIFLSDISARCTEAQFCGKSNSLNVQGKRGSLELSSIVADALVVSTESGRINMAKIYQLYEDGELRISSSSGAVKVDELVAKGSIRVETESGGITLIISVADGKAGFSGTFQVATAGDIRMEPEGEVAETEEEAADKEIFVNQKSNNLWEGSIGCHKDNDCNYRGELLITSSVGSITVIVGSDTVSA